MNYSYNSHRYILGKNIIIGDLENSKIILTAHYDTPLKTKIKNTCLRRKLDIAVIIILLLVVSGFSTSICTSFNMLKLSGLIFFIFTIIMFASNKRNANDNTSGILLLFEIMKILKKEEYKSKVCFIFFDQEELSKRGSKKFYKKYANSIKDKLLINFDCIGDGDTFYFITDDEKFKCTKIYDILKKSIAKESNFIFRTTKDYTFTSDHNSFPKNGIGVKAAKSEKNVEGFNYGSEKYHTWQDTELDEENINTLSKAIVKFIASWKKVNKI